MHLELLTPGKNIFSGEVKKVKLPGSGGYLGVLNNHAPLISALMDGELKLVTESGETKRYTTTGGVVEVKNNQIMILVESIENV